jgi:deoxycytidine triphosphate deaminase
MSVLSAQSIRKWCIPAHHVGDTPFYGGYFQGYPRVLMRQLPLLEPFSERGVIRGRSFGLSACTYDCRIAHPLVLPVGQGRLAYTVERFRIPEMICGSVLDKSSWARVFVTAFNTHLDPGWGTDAPDGSHLTLELVNLGDEVVEYLEGDPVCQVKFEWLDEPTELPYIDRKYSNQGPEPVPALLEQ